MGKQQAGFTLLEVTVAGFVFAIAALGLSSTMAQTGRLTDTSREEMTARMAARSVFAQLLATPFAELQGRHDSGFDVPGLRAAPGDADGLPGHIALVAGPEGTAGVHRVLIRVQWRGSTGMREIETQHLVADVNGALATPTAAAPADGGDDGGVMTLASVEEDLSSLFEELDQPGDTTTTSGTDSGTGNGKGKKK